MKNENLKRSSITVYLMDCAIQFINRLCNPIKLALSGHSEEWPHWAAIVIFGVLKPIHEKQYWQKHTQSNFPSINRSPNKLSLRNP